MLLSSGVTLLSGRVTLLSDGVMPLSVRKTLLSGGVMLLSGRPDKYLGNPFALAEGKVCLIVIIPFFPAPSPVLTLFPVSLQHMVLVPRVK